MFTILVILLGIFLAYMFGNDGNTTAMWVVIGLAALVVFGIFTIHEDDKAYVNRMHYWAMDGKDRAKARRRWDAEARAEEERARRQRLERARREEERLAAQIARRQQREYQKLARKLGIDYEKAPLPVLKAEICGKCRVKLRVVKWKRFGDGTTQVEYWCPGCGEQRVMDIGYVPLADPEKGQEERMAYLQEKQREYEEKKRAEAEARTREYLKWHEERYSPVVRGTFTCRACKNSVKPDWKRMELPEGTRLGYQCPVCGAINVKQFTD